MTGDTGTRLTDGALLAGTVLLMPLWLPFVGLWALIVAGRRRAK